MRERAVELVHIIVPALIDAIAVTLAFGGAFVWIALYATPGPV